MVNVLNFDHRRITEVLWVTVVVVWPLTRRRNCLCGLISLNFYLSNYYLPCFVNELNYCIYWNWKVTIMSGNENVMFYFWIIIGSHES
jgi:hypothetical protein